MIDFFGNCHCVNLRYTLAWPNESEVMPARACSCTFCRAHGAIYTSHPEALLNVVIEDVDSINRYRFGHETADFVLCRNCGVIVLAVCTIESDNYAVLNINTLRQKDERDFADAVTNFDTETPSERLARRKRNWIGQINMRSKKENNL